MDGATVDSTGGACMRPRYQSVRRLIAASRHPSGLKIMTEAKARPKAAMVSCSPMYVCLRRDMAAPGSSPRQPFSTFLPVVCAGPINVAVQVAAQVCELNVRQVIRPALSDGEDVVDGFALKIRGAEVSVYRVAAYATGPAVAVAQVLDGVTVSGPVRSEVVLAPCVPLLPSILPATPREHLVRQGDCLDTQTHAVQVDDRHGLGARHGFVVRHRLGVRHASMMTAPARPGRPITSSL